MGALQVARLEALVAKARSATAEIQTEIGWLRAQLGKGGRQLLASGGLVAQDERHSIARPQPLGQ